MKVEYRIEDKVGEQFIKIHGCLALIEYHNVDKWDYMLVGNYIGGQYVLIDGNTINIDNFTKSFNVEYIKETLADDFEE